MSSMRGELRGELSALKGELSAGGKVSALDGKVSAMQGVLPAIGAVTTVQVAHVEATLAVARVAEARTRVAFAAGQALRFQAVALSAEQLAKELTTRGLGALADPGGALAGVDGVHLCQLTGAGGRDALLRRGVPEADVLDVLLQLMRVQAGCTVDAYGGVQCCL